MSKKINYFVLFTLFSGSFLLPTETKPFFRSLISRTSSTFKFGMRGWVGLALCGTFGHYTMRCEHVKDMEDAPQSIINFVRHELLKAGLENVESIPVKVDTDQCLLYSPSTPKSEYDSCEHSMFICHALMVKQLKKLLQKEAQNNLTLIEQEELNTHRYFIRHQGRIIANKDHARILASRFIVPVVALFSSYLIQKGASRLLDKLKISSVLNHNFFTFAAKKAGVSCLTVGYELAVTLTFLKWYYQHRQRIANRQIDPLFIQPEVLQAGINHLNKLANEGYMRTNLSDFFVFESSDDYKDQAHNLQEQLANYV